MSVNSIWRRFDFFSASISTLFAPVVYSMESHRTYRIRYVRKYVSTDEDPYTYGTIRRPSGTRRRSAEAIPKRSGPSRQSLSKFAEIRLDTDRITYTYGDSACTEDGSRCYLFFAVTNSPNGIALHGICSVFQGPPLQSSTFFRAGVTRCQGTIGLCCASLKAETIQILMFVKARLPVEREKLKKRRGHRLITVRVRAGPVQNQDIPQFCSGPVPDPPSRLG
ncbi:hypothetical protein K438DRAFT_1762436 [Mycena galopus ATCC 62051]|nr:hypothetical protein K438DRAFT_1762436 [Mycena galopus ATCC 62051]